MNTWKLFRKVSSIICIGTVIGTILYGYFYMSDGVVDETDRLFLITAIILAIVSMFGVSIDMSTDGGKDKSKKAIMAGISFAIFMLLWRVFASIF